MSASMGVSFIVLVIAALSPVMLASRHAEERSKPALADHGASASAHADIAAAAPLEVQTPPKPDTYKIKSGDVLHVVVDGDAERSRDYTVESDGVILLVLTRPIKAAGATATDLANTVARTLTSASGAHLDPAIMATQVTTMQVRLDYATQQRELAEAKYTRLKALNLDDARAAYDRDIAKDGQVLALQREIAKFQDQYDSNWAAGMRDHNDVMKGLTSMITANKAELRDTMSRIVVAALEELNAARAVESRAANTLANVRNAAATSAASAATPRVTVTVRKKSATGAAEAESPVVPEAQTPPPASQPGAVADYRVGSQDVIQVDVLTPILRSLLPDGQYHIEADGAIRFPQVKDPVKIEGLTCREIEQRLKDVLRDAGVFDGAQFRVTVAQFRSQTVTFLGQGVKAVGPVTLGGNEVRLTAGLAQAGLQPEAANTIKIVHADGTETIVDRAEMESGHVDPILRTGDKIIVDKAPSIILDGEGVVRQGPVKWEPGLTVDQAVQRSGGYTKVAAKGSVTVWWIDDKGKKQTKDLKEEEIYTYVLKADDHVTIPKRIMGSSIP
jgi:protein involved in polysaccharide export with SLBB domain